MTLTINPNEDLGQQIARAANPILAAAIEESDRQPSRIVIPNLKYSPQILKILDDHEKAWGEWAELNTDLMEAIDDFENAYRAETDAMHKAIKAGADKHPGRAKSEKALDALEWATAKAASKRQEVSALADGRVERLIGAGVDTYLEQIRKQVDDAEYALEGAINAAKANYAEARHNAIAANEALGFMAPFVQQKYGLTYSQPMWDPVPEISWPKGLDLKLTHAANVFTALAAHSGGRAKSE